MAAIGLTRDDFAADDNVGIWPENWDAFNLFTQVMTQWRAGPGGAYGMDYNVLFHELDRMNLESERYDELFGEIRVMEFAALEEMKPKK